MHLKGVQHYENIEQFVAAEVEQLAADIEGIAKSICQSSFGIASAEDLGGQLVQTRLHQEMVTLDYRTDFPVLQNR
jgi:hypothetical protein